MGCVAIQHGAVSIRDLAGVVQHNNLGGEVLDSRSRLVLGVRGDIATLHILDGDVLDVESDVVPGGGLREGLVVHLNRLDLSGQHVGCEGDDHAGLDDTSLDTAHWNCSNTSNFVNILGQHRYRTIQQINRLDLPGVAA